MLSKYINRSFITRIIRFSKNEEKVMLGRWGISNEHTNIKLDQANHDSCGDRLCGDPLTLRNCYRKKEYKIDNINSNSFGNNENLIKYYIEDNNS